MELVKLQGIYEKQEAKQVKELKKGDVITWNFGHKSEVIDIQATKAKKSYIVYLKSLQDGIVRTRTMRATRLVCTGK